MAGHPFLVSGQRVPACSAKAGPRKCTPNPSGEAKVNALDNPNIQTSFFTPVSIPSENQLKVDSDAKQAGHAN